jgi:transposase InsO family protein
LSAVFACAPSTYYYQAVRGGDSDLIAAIEQVLMRRPWLGYRRVLAQLQRDGLAVGETVVRRVRKAWAHSRSVGQMRVHTTGSNHPYTRYTNLIRGMKATLPNQIGVADITNIRWGTKFIHLAVILDAYSCAVRGWALSRSLSQQLTLDALKMALSYGSP